MSIQLAATRRALESVVHAACPELSPEEVQAQCNHYVNLAKIQVEGKIPPARRRRTKVRAIREGGFLVRS